MLLRRTSDWWRKWTSWVSRSRLWTGSFWRRRRRCVTWRTSGWRLRRTSASRRTPSSLNARKQCLTARATRQSPNYRATSKRAYTNRHNWTELNWTDIVLQFSSVQFCRFVAVELFGHQWYWRYEYSDFPHIIFDSFIVHDTSLNKGEFRLLEVDNRIVIPISSNSGVTTSEAPWGKHFRRPPLPQGMSEF